MNQENIIATRKNKVIYREGDNCIKLFDKEFSKIDVLNEALNQARIEETGLYIPKIKEVLTIDGKWAIVSEYISGKTLKQLMDENPDKFDYYMNLFVDLQLEILSKSSPLLTKQREKMKRKVSMTSLSPTVKYDLHTRLDGMPKHNKVCHGDYRPSNIIISENGTPYITDWSHATQGNASADAARTYLTFCLSNQKDTAEKYLNIFCEKSKISKTYVQQWMPIVAASQSVKGHEEEQKMLLSWVEVVDYQ